MCARRFVQKRVRRERKRRLSALSNGSRISRSTSMVDLGIISSLPNIRGIGSARQKISVRDHFARPRRNRDRRLALGTSAAAHIDGSGAYHLTRCFNTELF